jgi:hypothetical protein
MKKFKYKIISWPKENPEEKIIDFVSNGFNLFLVIGSMNPNFYDWKVEEL